ncbi:MAG: polyamine aminopropyltransferase [Dehalococcoidia bacterium]|nr:polyamine aminopropyltransferase [Dehalococcoidia bacterium]
MAGPDLWFTDQATPGLRTSFGVASVLYQGRSAYQDIQVMELHDCGRCLVMDGKVQSAERDEFIYHEALVHPALIAHPRPRSVFIAGGGEGATLREALRHRTVRRAVMVELDPEAVRVCRELLPSWSAGAFEDPRTDLRYGDARRYLEQTPERYDVIILDISDPLEGGPAYRLFTREFYQLVAERLEPSGLVAVQAGAASLIDQPVFPAVVNTLAAVFPQVVAYQAHVPSFGSPWGFATASLQAAGRRAPWAWSPRAVDRRVSARVETPLRFYDGTTHQALFALPKYLREALAQERRQIADDAPLFMP